MMRQAQHYKKNCPIVAAWTLSARSELHPHPLAEQAQACGRITKGGQGQRARWHLSSEIPAAFHDTTVTDAPTAAVFSF